MLGNPYVYQVGYIQCPDYTQFTPELVVEQPLTLLAPEAAKTLESL